MTSESMQKLAKLSNTRVKLGDTKACLLAFSMRPAEAIRACGIGILFLYIFRQACELCRSSQSLYAKLRILVWQVLDDDQTETVGFRSKPSCDVVVERAEVILQQTRVADDDWLCCCAHDGVSAMGWKEGKAGCCEFWRAGWQVGCIRCS